MRWARGGLAAAVLGSFFLVSTVVGLLVSPLLLFRRSGPAAPSRVARVLNRGLGGVARMVRAFGLLRFTSPELPERYAGRPYLLVANHPTFLDVVILLGALPELTCVVKASWYRSPLLGPLLRLAGYIPGPGLRGDDERDTPVLDRIEAALRAGVPVLVFPEGTRSPWGGVRRFRRGAFEAAARVGVPVLPILVTVDRRVLTKGQRIWDLPAQAPVWRFEWLEPVGPRAAADTGALATDLRKRFRRGIASKNLEASCESV